MAPKKKPGKQLYVRMDQDVHARVAKTARALGMDINGLLNLLIRVQLPFYEVLAIHSQAGNPQAQEMLAALKESFPVVNVGDGRGFSIEVKGSDGRGFAVKVEDAPKQNQPPPSSAAEPSSERQQSPHPK